MEEYFDYIVGTLGYNWFVRRMGRTMELRSQQTN